MSTPSSTRIEIPFTPEEGGRALYVAGTVSLGGRWPRCSQVRVTDQRTEEDVELPDWALDKAEAALIEEAQILWAKSA